jgi:hypothetical protein
MSQINNLYIFCFQLFLISSLANLSLQSYSSDQESSSSFEDRAQSAFEHGVKVREEASCKYGRPQVIYVNSTDPSKVYLPRGTILHRCNDNTGCCFHAIEMRAVQLYFFTITLNTNNKHRLHRNKRKQHEQKIEKLIFNNHTRCACRARNQDLNLNTV